MTRRERIMALCVAGTLGGFAVVKVVQWTVLDPFKQVNASIKDERSRQFRLKKRLKGLRDVEAQWQAYTRRTLADDAMEAGRVFQKDLNELAERHGLRTPKISPGNPIKYKNGFVGVPLSISATGTLKDAVGFLTDFYERGYLARLDKVTLSSERGVIESVNSPRRQRRATARASQRGRRTHDKSTSRNRGQTDFGPEGPELKLNMTAVTLVLPRIPGVPHEVAGEIVEDPNLGGRLPRDVAAYSEIFDHSLFEPYQPPVKVVEKPPEPPKPTEPNEPEPVVVQRDPREDARHKMLVGTRSLNGEPVAYVMDDRRPDEPPEVYYLDQPIDDGTLLLIHPRGLVVRTEEGGRDQDWFYPLRAYPAPARFIDRVRLDRTAHPEVWQAMEKEFLNWGDGTETASREGDLSVEAP